MAFPRKLLNDGEELILDLRPHWLALAPSTLALVAAIVISFVVVFLGPDGTFGTVLSVIALALILVTLGIFLVRLLGWSNTNFVLTSDRVVTRRGVLTKSGIEIPLDRINTVFFAQRLIERMVGAGDLGIESAGERGTESFENIRKPAIVQREIYVQMEDNENRKFDRVRAPAPLATLSPVEQVERLHGLLQQGAITPAQYEAEKSRILGA
ncbi:PH domain-containing protein [Iamia sp. SCSIO 61187]|uniref:PH domain-containing protein n=1 Tax=Iamia sp. SCSIO 61187 TaxID=2722752 RepID=UPI001C635676|nr:PH domain-containing protein [Iamia sp. SCSIO 61187]QYG92621.1 PH domain-containing protein [Iamia sp. SCSIO 61187]